MAHAANIIDCAIWSIIALIVHVYAAIWVKGTLRAMMRGNVSAAWARHHHPGWYREVTGGNGGNTGGK